MPVFPLVKGVVNIMNDTKATGRTSEEVSKAGTYAPNCCDVEMFFDEGRTFQRCPRCERLTRWQLVTIRQGKIA
jgi:hypothetical protein